MFVNYDDETLDIESRPTTTLASAAGDGLEGGGIVLRAVAAQLVEELKAAAERGETYGSLHETFRRKRFAGREFYVDARPAECLDQVVLGTEVLRCARDDRAAGGAGR